MIRKMVKVKRLIASSDGGDWPPGNADYFLKWFSDHLSKIELRDSARIEIESLGCGDACCGVVQISLTYMRHESDDEIAHRKTIERMAEERKRVRDENIERIERQMLAELKKKYEG